MLVDIANATAADGHQVGVCITRASRTDLASELRPDIELHVLPRKKRFDPAALRSFSHLLQKRDIRIVHAHGRSSFSFCASANTFRPSKIPVILHDHHGSIEIDSQVPLWFRLWGRYHLTKYIGVYEKLRAWAISAGISPQHVTVIGNGINLARLDAPPAPNLRQRLGLEDDVLLGLVVAGLRPEKGIDLLIESLSQCGELNVTLLIVGGVQDKQYVEQCKLLAEEKGVTRKLVFLGERSDVAALNHSVDFALVPSRSESGPLVLIEFLAAGLPVVAFRVGDIAQVAAKDGIQGIVSPNDIEAFGKALTELVSLSTYERQLRGQFGLEVAERHFSIESKMPAFYGVYQQAMQNL